MKRSEYQAGILAKLKQLRCPDCDSPDVVMLDDGGGAEEGDWTLHLDASAWQCAKCGAVMGLKLTYPDDDGDE